MTVTPDFIPLHRHPLTPAPAVRALKFSVRAAADGSMALRYRLQGDLADLRIPARQPAGAADGLWAHTCFELFVADDNTDRYREFNFSPSGQWAAYAFDAYRTPAAESLTDTNPSPPITVAIATDTLAVDVVVAAAALPANVGGPLQVAIAAVVEDIDGRLSYWALHHSGAHPDFHHRDGFVLAVERKARSTRPPAARKP